MEHCRLYCTESFIFDLPPLQIRLYPRMRVKKCMGGITGSACRAGFKLSEIIDPSIHHVTHKDTCTRWSVPRPPCRECFFFFSAWVCITLYRLMETLYVHRHNMEEIQKYIYSCAWNYSTPSGKCCDFVSEKRKQYFRHNFKTLFIFQFLAKQ